MKEASVGALHHDPRRLVHVSTVGNERFGEDRLVIQAAYEQGRSTMLVDHVDEIRADEIRTAPVAQQPCHRGHVTMFARRREQLLVIERLVAGRKEHIVRHWL